MSAQRIAAILLAGMMIFAAAQCVLQASHTGVSTITQNVDELEDILGEIAFTSPQKEDRHIYQISFRTCPPCIQAHSHLLPALQEEGLETRLVTTARRHNSAADERAAVVENMRQGWPFTQDWWKDKSPRRFYAKTQLPLIDDDPERSAKLKRLQGEVDMLADIFAQNGKRFAFPAFIWQAQDGSYKAAIGYNPALKDIIVNDILKDDII